MIKILAIIWFLPFSLMGQDFHFSEASIIQILSAYRSKLITQNPKAIDEVRILEKNWGALDPENEELEYVALGIISTKNEYNYSNKAILNLIKKHCEGYKIVDKITEQDIEIILENAELFDLIIDEVVRAKYPFAINPNTTLITELDFYQIEHGQTIGEIGAGSGTFSILLGMINDQAQIAINELDEGLVRYINEKIHSNSRLLDTTNMLAIQGSRSDTKFMENEFDRIIIRNAFHHFSKKEKMLESIRRALKENGKLCLYEPILDPEITYSCSKVLEKQYLLSKIEASGFLLEGEEALGNYLLLRFIKK